jgi:hypothetical protein
VEVDCFVVRDAELLIAAALVEVDPINFLLLNVGQNAYDWQNAVARNPHKP